MQDEFDFCIVTFIRLMLELRILIKPISAWMIIRCWCWMLSCVLQHLDWRK